jgi:hypothetical protein
MEIPKPFVLPQSPIMSATTITQLLSSSKTKEL